MAMKQVTQVLESFEGVHGALEEDAGSRLPSKPPLLRPAPLSAPPTCRIPHDVLYGPNGQAAYEEALEKSGGVAVVPRQGRIEYLIGHQYAYHVLTDSRDFTFDQGVVRVLHMEFMMWFKNGSFVTEVDGLVQSGVQGRLTGVIREVAPRLLEGLDRITDGIEVDEKDTYEIEDMFARIQSIIAEAMVVLIFGSTHLRPDMVKHFTAITNAVARICGFDEEIDGWHRYGLRWLYGPVTTLQAVLFVILPRLLFCLLPEMWRSRHNHLTNVLNSRTGDFVPLFDSLLARHWRDTTGISSLGNFMWCMVCTLAIVFASIHQTVVVSIWTILHLALKQEEYLAALREEWEAVIPYDGCEPGHRDLEKLVLLDSFIREVMRTKGDTFSPVRFTTRPTQIGQYMLPKGAICLPYAPACHRSDQPFDGFQWVKQGRPAVQGGEKFISFGLGRWACPGRSLAVSEIKLTILGLFSKYDIKVKDERYQVLDRLNTTAVAPKASFQLRKRVVLA